MTNQIDEPKSAGLLQYLLLIVVTLAVMGAVPVLIIGQSISIYVMGAAGVLCGLIIGYVQRYRKRGSKEFFAIGAKTLFNGAMFELLLCVIVKYLGLH